MRPCMAGRLEEMMERLTERFYGWVIKKGCHGPCRTCHRAECADIYPMIDRLAAYEDTGLEPEEIMGLCSMDRRAKMAELLRMEENKPLTLEELRKMDGEPVFIIPTRGSGGFCTWMLVDTKYDLCREVHGEMAVFENCGKTWLAYRRKPEENT